MKLICHNPDKEYMVYHQTPKRRTIVINGSVFFLSFPHLYFKIDYKPDHKLVFNYCGLAEEEYAIGYFAYRYLDVVFSSGPTENLLFYPSLPNVSLSSSVCLGKQLLYETNLDDLANEVVSAFWQTHFKIGETDGALYDKYALAHHTAIFDFMEKWQSKSKNDPSWMPQYTTKNKLYCSYEEWVNLS